MSWLHSNYISNQQTDGSNLRRFMSITKEANNHFGSPKWRVGNKTALLLRLSSPLAYYQHSMASPQCITSAFNLWLDNVSPITRKCCILGQGPIACCIIRTIPVSPLSLTCGKWQLLAACHLLNQSSIKRSPFSRGFYSLFGKEVPHNCEPLSGRWHKSGVSFQKPGPFNYLRSYRVHEAWFIM